MGNNENRNQVTVHRRGSSTEVMTEQMQKCLSLFGSGSYLVQPIMWDDTVVTVHVRGGSKGHSSGAKTPTDTSDVYSALLERLH